MRVLTRLYFALGLAVLFPGAVFAQTCFGGPSLATSSGNIRAGADFIDGVNEYGIGATFGSQPLFFGGGFSFADIDNSEVSAKTLSALIGTEFRPSTSSSDLMMCAVFSTARVFGIELLGVDLTSWNFIPALAVGYNARVSPTVSVVPAAQVSVVHARFNADAGVFGEASESDTSVGLSFGLGFLFNERFSVGPRIAIPLSSDDGDTVFGVTASIAFGS